MSSRKRPKPNGSRPMCYRLFVRRSELARPHCAPSRKPSMLAVSPRSAVALRPVFKVRLILRRMDGRSKTSTHHSNTS
jgi:hypothetical protein